MLKKLVVFLLVISICFVSILFPSCKKQQTGEVSARMDGATLVWDAYDGAASYSVTCNLKGNDADGATGYSITVKGTSFLSPYSTPGDYVFTVKAMDKDGKVIAASKPVSYHLGTGEAADAVLIGSADDLKAVATSYELTFGKTKVEAPIYYRLTADIDLTGKTVDPIGSTTKPFRGVFDGAGHTIRGLSFTKGNTDGNVGLFGYAKNAVIKNLTIEDASLLFDKNSNVGKGELNCGFLVADSVSSIIDNCHVTGNMEILSNVITMDSAILSAGGIVGRAESGMVSGVSFSGDVKAQYGRAYAGGIVGFGQGTSPEFMILNSKSVATVSAVGTAYTYKDDTHTTTSYAYARAGVLVGNLSHAGRLASLIAIGTASAASTVDGTNASNVSSGVIGRASTLTSGAYSAPTYALFYSDNFTKPVGAVSSLGSYADHFIPLSEDQLKAQDSYSYTVNENEYGLGFDTYWSVSEGNVPTLKKVPTVSEGPSLKLTVASEVTDHVFSYDLMLEDAFLPTYFDLNLTSTNRVLGYGLNDILTDIDATLNDLYADGDTARIKISAEGFDDLIISRSVSGTTSVSTYLVYGLYTNYETPAQIFSGFKIIDAGRFTTYDYTKAKHITITFLAPGAEA